MVVQFVSFRMTNWCRFMGLFRPWNACPWILALSARLRRSSDQPSYQVAGMDSRCTWRWWRCWGWWRHHWGWPWGGKRRRWKGKYSLIDYCLQGWPTRIWLQLRHPLPATALPILFPSPWVSYSTSYLQRCTQKWKVFHNYFQGPNRKPIRTWSSDTFISSAAQLESSPDRRSIMGGQCRGEYLEISKNYASTRRLVVRWSDWRWSVLQLSSCILFLFYFIITFFTFLSVNQNYV